MRLVEFPLEDTTSVIVEVHEPEGVVRAGAKEEIARAKQTLEEALGKVLPATKSVVEKVRAAAGKPNEIEISFGINLSTAVGAFIAAAGTEANFCVTMRWTDASEQNAPAQAQPQSSPSP
jgi:hypothetical protein